MLKVSVIQKEEISDIVLNTLGKDDSLVTYEDAEPFTTQVKKIDFSKCIHDLNHNSLVSPEEGIQKTVDWMKWYYRLDKKTKPMVETTA